VYTRRICPLLLFGALLLVTSLQLSPTVLHAASPSANRATQRITGAGIPWINLEAGCDLPTSYHGPARLVRILKEGQAHPLSLATADFDEDGMPDLVSGYFGPDGILVLHRGNVDALYPNSPEAQQHRASGSFTPAPFLAPPRVFALPTAPDFMGTGDFNADGHQDVIIATRGTATLHVLPGNGKGSFDPAQAVKLPGEITAMAVGEINRQDGLTDIIVGVTSSSGPKVLVFEGPEGALSSTPEIFTVPAIVNALTLGQLDEHYEMDLAVGAGSQLILIHGRDRHTLLSETSHPQTPPAKVDVLDVPSDIVALAVGDFVSGPDFRSEVALLAEEGTLFLLDPTTSKIIAVRPNAAAGGGPRSSHRHLISIKISTLQTDDLVVVDPFAHHLRVILTSESPQITGRPHALFSPIQEVIAQTTLDITGDPVAALPMRLNKDALSDLVILNNAPNPLTVLPTSPAATFIVNSAGDDGDGDLSDGICDTGENGLTGICTLRAAIEQANASPGADEISFGGRSLHIRPETGLPDIEETLTIDATASNHHVELDGSRAGAGVNGFSITAPNCVVRGLVINRFQIDGNINGSGIVLVSSGNIIEGNYLGTDTSGSSALGNESCGVMVSYGASGNRIGGTTDTARNVLSGNKYYGVAIQIDSSGNEVQGNYIGTNASGTAAIPGEQTGVGIIDAPNNLIGGNTAAKRNVISGNSSEGIVIFSRNTSRSSLAYPAFRTQKTMPQVHSLATSGSTGNLVQGNYVGLQADGTQPLANGGTGVLVQDASSNTIGGATSGNIIAANLGNGITIQASSDATASANVVIGNYIGTDKTGQVSDPDGVPNSGDELGNHYNGVTIGNAAANLIGGTTEGARNVIAGNGASGILVVDPGATQNTIQNNYIGLDLSRSTTDLGNGADGISIVNAPHNLLAGDSTTHNVIAFNKAYGIRNLGPQAVTIESVEAIGNDAWGIYAGGTVTITQYASVDGNGSGGIEVAQGNLFAGGTQFQSLEIVGNNGVGLQSNGTMQTVNLQKAKIRSNNGHGISVTNHLLQLQDVEIGDNCGWGIRTLGSVLITSSNTVSVTNSISDNGSDTGCQGGGVLSLAGDSEGWVKVVNAEITGNGGPGILALEDVTVDGVRINSNRGAGIVAQSGYVTFPSSSLSSQIRDNQGIGIDAYGEEEEETPAGVVAQQPVVVSGNGGWGIRSQGGYVSLKSLSLSQVSGNGKGSTCYQWTIERAGNPHIESEKIPCEGGGILAAGASDPFWGGWQGVELYHTEVINNNGPGILSWDDITLDDVKINDNRGYGVYAQAGDVSFLQSSYESQIIGNQGVGIAAFGGDDEETPAGVHAEQLVVISNNGGWGIRAEKGFVSLGSVGGLGIPGLNQVNNNGKGDHCYLWEMESPGDIFPDVAEEPCEGGGILTAGAGDPFWGGWQGVELRHTEVISNGGPGILSWDDITLDDVKINDNRGYGVYAQAGDASFLQSSYESQIIGNQGVGIAAMGSTSIAQAVEVSGNGAWGIYTEMGTVTVDVISSQLSRIDNNGRGQTCYLWQMTSVGDVYPDKEQVSCEGGGVLAERSPVSLLSRAEVNDNGSHGIVGRSVKMKIGEVCRNNGHGIVSIGGQVSLGAVQLCENVKGGLYLGTELATTLKYSISGSARPSVASVTWEGPTTSTIFGSRIADNGDNGVCFTEGSPPLIRHSAFVRNSGFGVNNLDDTVIVDARENWWGDASGPGGIGPGNGDEVSEYVDYIDWLTTPITLTLFPHSNPLLTARGVTATTWIHLQNWEHPTDTLTMTLVDTLGWYNAPSAFTVTLEGSAGASVPISFTIPAHAALGTTDYVTATATSHTDPDTSETISFPVIVTTTTDLIVVKGKYPSRAAVGRPLTYTLAVSTRGPDDATGIIVTDTLPTGVIPLSSNTSQGKCIAYAEMITCNLETLSHGAAATITIVVTPTVTGMLPNQATASSNEYDPNPYNNTDIVSSIIPRQSVAYLPIVIRSYDAKQR